MAETTAEKKARATKLERLERELAEARAAEAAKNKLKREKIQGQLDAAKEQLERIKERVRVLTAALEDLSSDEAPAEDNEAA